uniref:hypothetical protein n=1 Tax=Rhodococcus qingshengii TaxID=334542 RepID=UPI001C4E20DB|nr:hypothetical protein [Rhodococcus qingshengii]
MVKTNLWKRRTLVSVVLVVLSLAVAPVAGASPDTLDQPAPESPAVEEYPSTDLPPEMMQVPGAGQQCVNTALERNISNWVCNGAMLITPDGQEVLPVVPRPDLVEPVPPPNPQSRLNDDPDYDTWYEPDSSSPCIREISQYQSEAKSNMIYGDEDGVVGTFDWIVHLNLNGRSTRITTTVIHDEGPSLNFIRHDAHCREVVAGPLPDTSCGINYMGSPFTISEASPRFNYGPAQGSNIVDAGTYFIEGRMQFQPSGYDYVWSIPTSPSVWGPGPQSERFICPTQNRNCYFNR